MMIGCNVVLTQVLWIPYVRRNPTILWVISIFLNIGMWLERYVIIVTSLHRDYLPSSWSMYHGTIWDYMTFYGTLGFFLTLMFLFVRLLPAISIVEMRELVHETQRKPGPANGSVIEANGRAVTP